jgi:hypothetical protein
MNSGDVLARASRNRWVGRIVLCSSGVLISFIPVHVGVDILIGVPIPFVIFELSSDGHSYLPFCTVFGPFSVVVNTLVLYLLYLLLIALLRAGRVLMMCSRAIKIE